MTPLQCFAVHHWGQWDLGFFGQKIGTAQRPGVPHGSIIGVSRAHAHNFFCGAIFHVTREIDKFRQNFGIFLRAIGPRYSYQNFTAYV